MKITVKTLRQVIRNIMTEANERFMIERFGEPVSMPKAHVGIADEGSGGKSTWVDEPKKDQEWSDPNVVKEDCECPHDDDADRLDEDDLEEESPPGWEGTVKAMKKHKEIDNPWALAWHMKNKGAKSHYTKSGKKKKS